MQSIPEPTGDDASQIEAKAALNVRSIALMHQVGRGDPDAFRELVELHQSAVIGTCVKMLGNIDDAHDLAQQVFLRVWKSAPRYEPTAKFTTWLFTITRNLVFNHTRNRKRGTFISLDAEDAPRIDEAHRSASAPDAAALQRELADAIDSAIQALPETQRMAVVLRRYEDLPYEEIASVMETSVSAVKSLLFRARTELREALRTYLDTNSK